LCLALSPSLSISLSSGFYTCFRCKTLKKNCRGRDPPVPGRNSKPSYSTSAANHCDNLLVIIPTRSTAGSAETGLALLALKETKDTTKWRKENRFTTVRDKTKYKFYHIAEGRGKKCRKRAGGKKSERATGVEVGDMQLKCEN
jgi:hypothetical protein